MTLYWTKSSSLFSKLIRWTTGDDCSHFSIVLYEGKAGEIMFESNLLGTHPAFLQTTLKTHKVIHQFQVPTSLAVENKIWDRMVSRYDGKEYDFGGALYLGIRKLMKRFLRIKMPDENFWADPNKFFCCELFEIFDGLDILPQVPPSNAMRTPHDYWEFFK